MQDHSNTDFGYSKVPTADKPHLVDEVFSRVAKHYDLMNDVMSLGIHRLWKRHFVKICAIQEHHQVLDLAGGTGDIAKLIYPKISEYGHVVLCDVNSAMLELGRKNMIDHGYIKNINYIKANAEELPFKDNYFDCVTISFGLRNITNKKLALNAIYHKLNFGGKLVILEFSRPTKAWIARRYDQYSMHIIPKLGKLIAGDESSYQYLVESIRMHPDQNALASILTQTGFEHIKYYNLSFGIVAIHIAYKI